jgi:predicted DNA binding CopG/RHH family protein
MPKRAVEERPQSIGKMTAKRIHRFKNEEAERRFWAKHDSTEFIDWSQGKRTLFPNLRPSTKTISLRLPESLLEALRALARKRDVPYQSLLKMFLAERIEREFHHPRPIRQKG